MKWKLLPVFLYFLYNSGISFAQKGVPEPGAVAPGFTGLSVYGKPISLDTLLKNGPVVLVFYRGEWCSYCDRHMNSLRDSISLIRLKGATVVAITPERKEFADPDNEQIQDLHIVPDAASKIMSAYGVIRKLGWPKRVFHTLRGENLKKRNVTKDPVLPVPATFIIGKNGKIIARHYDLNFRLRMPVNEIARLLPD